jgi:hypothetical protein
VGRVWAWEDTLVQYLRGWQGCGKTYYCAIHRSPHYVHLNISDLPSDLRPPTSDLSDLRLPAPRTPQPALRSVLRRAPETKGASVSSVSSVISIRVSGNQVSG